MPIGWVRNIGGFATRPDAASRNLFIRQTVFEQVADIAVSVVDDVVTVVHRILEAEV